MSESSALLGRSNVAVPPPAAGVRRDAATGAAVVTHFDAGWHGNIFTSITASSLRSPPPAHQHHHAVAIASPDASAGRSAMRPSPSPVGGRRHQQLQRGGAASSPASTSGKRGTVKISQRPSLFIPPSVAPAPAERLAHVAASPAAAEEGNKHNTHHNGNCHHGRPGRSMPSAHHNADKSPLHDASTASPVAPLIHDPPAHVLNLLAAPVPVGPSNDQTSPLVVSQPLSAPAVPSPPAAIVAASTEPNRSPSVGSASSDVERDGSDDHADGGKLSADDDEDQTSTSISRDEPIRTVPASPVHRGDQDGADAQTLPEDTAAAGHLDDGTTVASRYVDSSAAVAPGAPPEDDEERK